VQIEYGVPKYTFRDGAVASGFTLNTLRSLYGRGHFQIVGGEAKKGRGMSAELTFEDIMCIAVAKVPIDAGVHPRIAFEAAKSYAYYADPGRTPCQLFPEGFTALVMHPAVGASAIVNFRDAIGFAELFSARSGTGRPAAVVALINDVERHVYSRLGAFHKLANPGAE
jgi:hypothetical protein